MQLQPRYSSVVSSVIYLLVNQMLCAAVNFAVD